MKNYKFLTKTLLFSSLLFLGLSVLNSPVNAESSSSTNIKARICVGGPKTPEIELSSPDQTKTIYKEDINLKFSTSWGKKLAVKVGSNNLPASNLDYEENYKITKPAKLNVGNNLIQVEVTGGCPKTTVTKTFSLNYDNSLVGIKEKKTKDRSPELTGTISSTDGKIQLTINNKTYNATNNGNGTWTLDKGIISPELADGQYDVRIAVYDPNNNSLIVSKEFPKVLKIKNTKPIVKVETDNSDDRSPEIKGTIDDPNVKIKVTINNKEYDAINNGDGSWTIPKGTVDDLTNGEYLIVANAYDDYGNKSTYEKLLIIKAKNQIGFVLAPNTGYFRIKHVNFPISIIYLLIIMIILGSIIRLQLKKSKNN